MLMEKNCLNCTNVRKVVMIGCGFVGAASAFSLMQSGMFSEMVLIDMAICSENILLEAEALNLGAVMIGIAPFNDRMKDVAKIINLPENLEPFMLIPVGYPVNKHPQEDRYEPSKIHEI